MKALSEEILGRLQDAMLELEDKIRNAGAQIDRMNAEHPIYWKTSVECIMLLDVQNREALRMLRGIYYGPDKE